MVRFIVEEFTLQAAARLGRIVEWGQFQLKNSVPTPGVTVYTRAGHIPHVTHSVARLVGLSVDNFIYNLPLSTLVALIDRIDGSTYSFKKFVGLRTSDPTIITFNDPAEPIKSGYNSNKGSSVWNYTGRVALDLTFFQQKVMPVLGLDAIQLMCDSDTPVDCSNKRLQKAVDRTAEYVDGCIIYKQDRPDLEPGTHRPIGDAWATIEGGTSEPHRLKCAERLLNHSKDISGFFLEGFHQFGPIPKEFTIAPQSGMLEKLWQILPRDKPRFLPGAFTPAQVWEAVEAGVDLFDSSYAYLATTDNKLLTIGDDYPAEPSSFSLVPVTSEDFKEDMSAPDVTCKCYACTKYTKAYLHHLANTDEMLGKTLLMIHNLTQYLRCFDMIRTFLKQSAASESINYI